MMRGHFVGRRSLEVWCCAGLLALLALWWVSLRSHYEFEVSPRSSNWTLSAILYSGTIDVSFRPYDQAKSRFSLVVIPEDSLHHQIRDAYGPLGVLDIERSSVGGIGSGSVRFRYFAALPIWLPWIAAVGFMIRFTKGFNQRACGTTSESR